jgi:cell division protein FtsL
MINPDLKAHQALCAWASGSLEINCIVQLLVLVKENEKTREERENLQRGNSNSKIEEETFSHHTNIDEIS